MSPGLVGELEIHVLLNINIYSVYFISCQTGQMN